MNDDQCPNCGYWVENGSCAVCQEIMDEIAATEGTTP